MTSFQPFYFLSRFSSALLLFACAGSSPAPPPAPLKAPPSAAGPVSEPVQGLKPPPPGITPDAPFPAIARRELENGLGLRVVERHLHPIVELRLVVRSGTATDGEKPGLSVVAGELLKAGGAGPWGAQELVRRAEGLGADLNVITDRDSTRISLGVTSGDLEAAMEVLAAVALRPRFSPIEFTKLREREIERVKSSARGSASWAASMVLYRELYELPTTLHPYSRYDAMPEDLAKLALETCKAWHKTHFVPSNATLVVAGDVTPDVLAKSAQKWFGAWKDSPAPGISLTQPLPAKERVVYLVDRPGSAQSQIYVGLLGPERAGAEWPSMHAANQILGGGVSGRLFLDVREKRSLAYSTGSSLGETRMGPVPIVLSAGSQTAKTVDAVQALLENLEALGSRSALESELERAKRFLNDSFVFRLETVGSVAELTSLLYVLGLPDDYYDEYRKAVRALSLPQVSTTASRYYQRTPVIVVAGDGATLGPSLAKFGPVTVLDPERQFALKKSYPKAP